MVLIGIPITLPENRATKTNVDVVDKRVNSETKLSTREICVPYGHPIIRPDWCRDFGLVDRVLVVAFSVQGAHA